MILSSTSTPPLEHSRSAILSLNVGSSSIKFAAYQLGDEPTFLFRGTLNQIAPESAAITLINANGDTTITHSPTLTDEKSVINFLIHLIEQQECFGLIRAVGHRVTQGMYDSAPIVITQTIIDELKATIAIDPEHLLKTVELMESLLWRHPSLIQIACSDCTFHQSMPVIMELLNKSQRYAEKRVPRSGFHGLSYSYLVQELVHRGDAAAVSGRVVLAHLGSGSSLTAVRDGKSIDNSMGFTPAGGLPMGTRANDLNLASPDYYARSEHLMPEHFQQLADHKSELLSDYKPSSDMADLLSKETINRDAENAITLFCYQAKKLIGSYAAALGGIDTLVFAGGIGENSAVIRERICDGLNFLGIELDAKKNAEGADIISTQTGRVRVHIIRTNEEIMITRLTAEILPTNYMTN